MGWRTYLEDDYTVVCKRCGLELIEPFKKPNQQYIINKPCPKCGYIKSTRQEKKKLNCLHKLQKKDIIVNLSHTSANYIMSSGKKDKR
jgi:predicted secreted protein